ncbi:hypothetical protein GYMLUDRAFT_766757 [Collybiopsis luxurians FD-317 M1]|uniref:Carrier domain-containing protein n=1 Tax=Collybiopsis luxurians FD-317 M1 TaxID=944289 RepID=A0A0D0B252_9AGAR|nr:hypothetical protein GYMLUDRAFT_766757 [Collybiopsis luxurians FD-317 M1]
MSAPNPADGSTSHLFENVLDFPTLQGSQSATFHRPPLDGSLTVPELFAWHSHHSPKHPVFVYSADDENQETRAICYPEVYKAIGVAARIVKNSFKISNEHLREGNGAPVIGILAIADTISYYTFILGVMHLGFTPFPISTRNSPVAVAHLLRKTHTVQLYVSDDPAMQKLANDAVALVENPKDDSPAMRIDILEMVYFNQLYLKQDDPESDPAKLQGKMSQDNITLILHSSGSTALPKPIPFLGRNHVKWGTLPYSGEVDICDMPIACHTVSMFHAMGAINIVWPVCCGSLVACFAPAHPPVIPTPDTFFAAILKTKCRLIYTVPTFIEVWAQKPENLPILQGFKAISFAGGPLNKSIGDMLSAAGVTLSPFYGLTETGCIGMFLPANSYGDEWAYFKVSPHLNVKMIPQDGLGGIFEPVVLASATYSPHLINTTIDGWPAYTTNDLLEVHPTNPAMFRVFGRKDDLLMLSTGEKTNPVPLETMLNQDANVTVAIMFGRGRFQNGVLIQPAELFNPDDETQLAAFRNKIWPTVEKVNEYAPSHSRIFKEMIMVTNPSKPVEFTAKGTPRRQATLDVYAPEIDALYEKVENSSQTGVTLPEVLNEESIQFFVQKIVHNIMPVSVDPDADIFQHGCDSLQATWIRNALLQALRRSNRNALVHDVPLEVVYEHPSIRSLAAYMYNILCDSVTPSGDTQTKANQMLDLLKKYKLPGSSTSKTGARTSLNGVNGNGHRINGDTVLITGTTGRFGCHILAQLLVREDVVRIYALNRESSDGDASPSALQRRQVNAFKTWGLDEQLLKSDKVVYVVGRLDRPLFDLEASIYEKLLKTVNIAIHNAWRIDFNIKLLSFEPLLLGVHNLLRFCSESQCEGTKPRVFFISTLATVNNHLVGSPVKEEPFNDPAIAIGNGYSESKWVAEQLFHHAATECGLNATVVRSGQLSGDTKVGGWGQQEWVPTMVSLSQTLGSVPSRDETVSWFSADVAATVLIDIVKSSIQEPVLHLTSPLPVPWDTAFGGIAKRLGLPLVPYSQWLESLESLAIGGKTATGVTALLPFFRQALFGEHVADVSKTRQVSSAMCQAKPLSPEEAALSVDYWTRIGFLRAPSSTE